MSDQTVEALRRIKAHAAELGVMVDRVEVSLHEDDGKTAVQFTAHYIPKPMEQSTACIGYSPISFIDEPREEKSPPPPADRR